MDATLERIVSVHDGGAHFSAKHLSMRAQKKILGKMSSRSIAKHFISDTAARLLDNLYRILKDFYTKKEAEKVVKNVIKMAIKMGVLAKNEQFNEDQRRALSDFQRKYRQLCLTIVSFAQVHYSYDRAFLRKLLAETQSALIPVVRAHLSGKSADRVEFVFEYLGREEFCDSVFKVGGLYEELLGRVVADLDRLMDEERRG